MHGREIAIMMLLSKDSWVNKLSAPSKVTWLSTTLGNVGSLQCQVFRMH